MQYVTCSTISNNSLLSSSNKLYIFYCLNYIFTVYSMFLITVECTALSLEKIQATWSIKEKCFQLVTGNTVQLIDSLLPNTVITHLKKGCQTHRVEAPTSFHIPTSNDLHIPTCQLVWKWAEVLQFHKLTFPPVKCLSNALKPHQKRHIIQ